MDDFMKIMQQAAREKFGLLNKVAKKGQILFVGSSLMEGFPIDELLMSLDISKKIYNRGIGGFTTENMLESMEEMVFGLEPARIFINIGTNDIAAEGYTLEKLLDNYQKILNQIQKRLPQTKFM